jgi:hypothetical protein
MPEGQASGGAKISGFVEIRDGEGKLLVAFSSEDAEDYWGQRYQAERIRYAMRKRRQNIPQYLRTGEPPPKGRKIEAIKLRVKNLLRR